MIQQNFGCRWSYDKSFAELRAAIILQAMADIEVGVRHLTIKAARFGQNMSHHSSNLYRSNTERDYRDAIKFFEDKDNMFMTDSLREQILKVVNQFRNDYIHRYLGLTKTERERVNLWMSDCVRHREICRFGNCERCNELREKLYRKRFGEDGNNEKTADGSVDYSNRRSCILRTDIHG